MSNLSSGKMAGQNNVYVAQEPPATSVTIADEMKNIFRRMGLNTVDYTTQQSTTPKTFVLWSPQGRLYAEVDNIRKYFLKDKSGQLVVAVVETDNGKYEMSEGPDIKDRNHIQESVYLFVRNEKLERRYFGLLFSWKNTKSLCRVYDTFQKNDSNSWFAPVRKWDAVLGIPRMHSTILFSLVVGLGLFLRRGFKGR